MNATIGIRGHSGCSVKVVRFEGRSAILKSAPIGERSNRLELQCMKQKGFQGEGGIRAPKILTQRWCDDGHFEFIMEYVHSIDFIHFIESSTPARVKNLLAQVLNGVHESFESAVTRKIAPDTFYDKIDEISSRVSSELRRGLNASLKHVRLLLDENKGGLELPVGRCHGDLTYSNILVQDDNVYLIDFLNTYIESPLSDLVKLRQDTRFMWSVNLVSRRVDKVRIAMMSSVLDGMVLRVVRKRGLENSYRLLEFMNLLRIAPYAKDGRAMSFILQNLRNLERDQNG